MVKLAAVFGLEALLLGAIGIVALDMRAHHRVEDLGGVNVWGYRGNVLRQKQPDEIRVASVGGDLAFGWGVAASETLPYFVRRLAALEIDRPGRPLKPVTAVNLAARGLPAADYAAWIARWRYLAPDVMCILPDPEDYRGSGDRFLPDRSSRFFTTFGYSPILPLVLDEKGARMQSPAVRWAGALLARLDPMTTDAARADSPRPADALDAAVRAALSVSRMGVVLVLPVDAGADARRVAIADSRVRIVDLGRVPADTTLLTLDGFHFGAAGHSWVADAVAPAALDLIRAADPSTR